jgi:hypothetical protein
VENAQKLGDNPYYAYYMDLNISEPDFYDCVCFVVQGTYAIDARVFGSPGNDCIASTDITTSTLYGEGGDDTLVGGAVQYGGDGFDTCVKDTPDPPGRPPTDSLSCEA